MEYRLILINELQTSPTTDDKKLDNCPFLQEIGIPITLQISEIRNPETAGSGSYTKPISIPGTAEVNKFFEDVYDVNVSLQYFDPNIKIKAYYYEDSIPVFDGHLQLLKIVVDEVSESWIYECNIIGEVVNLFTKTKNKLVEDIDVSAYDHALTYANITSSWTTPLSSSGVGSGVVYPQIDWGDNNSNLSQMKPTDFRGCLFYRDILNRIFTAAGYTWTSTFLDSNFFKRLYFVPTEKPTLTQTVLDNNKFLAVANGSQVHTKTAISATGTLILFTNSSFDDVTFHSETYDNGNIFATPSFTVPVSNKYNVTANLGLNFVVKKNGVDVSSNIIGTQSGIHVCIYNTTTSQIAAMYDLNVGSASFAVSNSNQAQVAWNNVQLTAGHVYKVSIRYNSISLVFNTSTAGFTWTLESTILSGSNFAAEFASVLPYEGATVNCNGLLPLNYKQSDFISDIIKTYNLRVMPDKSNPTNLIIEDEPNFHKPYSQARDWFKKHDKSSKVEVLPVGDLDYTKVTAKYSEDGDYYNTLHQTEFKEPYGTNVETVTNDFIKGEVVIQPSYAPTPYAFNPTNQMVIPAIIKKDNNTISEFKPKMRMLYWSGLITLPTGISWTFTYNNGANSVVWTQQAHGGHTNNPYAPTLDLSFRVPKKIYYTSPNQQWTTNNIWNKYFSVDFQRRTDKNSKIIRTRFYLTSDDINIFDFRYPIFTEINNETGYYWVNKIEDYNRLVSDSTMVELLKLIDYPAFVPETVVAFNSGLGNENNSHNKTSNSNFTGGPNNINYADNSILQGGNANYLAPGGDSIALLNSENVTVPAIENFVGVGINSDSEVDSNMVNLMDKVKIYEDGHGALSPRVLRVTGNFTVDGKYSIYEIDLDSIGVAITATWDAVAYPVQVTFKCVANSGAVAFYIDDMTSPPSSPPQTIDGNALPYTTGLTTYDSLTVYSNGTNLMIK